jgi:hypothetical protein
LIEKTLYLFLKISIVKNGNFSKVEKYILVKKICQIKYARIQGKAELEKHFKDTIVLKKKEMESQPYLLQPKTLSNIEELILKQKKSI